MTHIENYPRPCEVCRQTYQPASGRQNRCPDCRLTKAEHERLYYVERRKDPAWCERRRQQAREAQRRYEERRKQA